MVITGVVNAQETGSAATAETDWSQWNAKWVPAAGKFAGQPMPQAQLQIIELAIKDGQFELQMPGITEKGKLTKVAPAGDKPGTLDIKIEEGGPNKGKTIPAIYRFDEGKLIVCYGLDEKRPTDFISDTDNPNLLLEYRKKDDK